jgi:5-methylcytosine-specific restriction endonuclease McrA
MISVREIHKRDNGICGICKQGCQLSDASRDHIVPKSHGGSSSQSNLRLAHMECNMRRGAPDISVVAPDENLRYEFLSCAGVDPWIYGT